MIARLNASEIEDDCGGDLETNHVVRSGTKESERISNLVGQGKGKRRKTVISRQEEIELAKKIQLARVKMRLALLSCDCILVRVLDGLEKISIGTVRLDRYLDVPVSKIEEKDRLREMIQPIVKEVRELRKANQEDFRKVVDKTLPIKQRKALWRTILRRKRGAATQIERLKVRDARLREAVSCVETTIEAWSNDDARAPDSQKNSRQTMLQRQDTLATLSRRFRLFKKHESSYSQLRSQLATEHYRFVVKIARQYETTGFGLLDLIQEGTIGLLRAIERYDPQRGFRLITYAEWWIRQEIHNALLKTLGPVAIPGSLSVSIRRFTTIVSTLKHELNRDPYLEEIAKGMDLSIEQTRHIMLLSSQQLSLHQTHSRFERLSMIDLIADRKNACESKQVVLRHRLESILEHLDSRERDIVAMRFGLEDGDEKTLADVASKYSLSRERIRQIESKALAKLRSNKFRNQLDDLIDEVDVRANCISVGAITH